MGLFHDWYYGIFQTGEKSPYTGDHVGVRGRVCLDCKLKQVWRRIAKRKYKYIDVDDFKGKSNG